MKLYQFFTPRPMVDSNSRKLSRERFPLSSAGMRSQLANRALFRAMLTPVEKMGSTNRAASPIRIRRSSAICFIA